MILLGKNSGILEANVNTQEEVNEEYITPSVLEKVNLNCPNLNAIARSSSSSSFSSSSSSQDTPTKNENLPETTDDALEYIAGYLAKKHKKDHPELGNYTYKLVNEHSYVVPSWVTVFWWAH